MLLYQQKVSFPQFLWHKIQSSHRKDQQFWTKFFYYTPITFYYLKFTSLIYKIKFTASQISSSLIIFLQQYFFT